MSIKVVFFDRLMFRAPGPLDLNIRLAALSEKALSDLEAAVISLQAEIQTKINQLQQDVEADSTALQILLQAEIASLLSLIQGNESQELARPGRVLGVYASQPTEIQPDQLWIRSADLKVFIFQGGVSVELKPTDHLVSQVATILGAGQTIEGVPGTGFYRLDSDSLASDRPAGTDANSSIFCVRFDPPSKAGYDLFFSNQADGGAWLRTLSPSQTGAWRRIEGVNPALVIMTVGAELLPFRKHIIQPATYTLPASPPAGTWIEVTSPDSVTTTTIERNGNTILGKSENFVLDVPNRILRLTFQAGDWSISSVGIVRHN